MPTAPLVLFLHGFPEYSGAWDEVLPAFAGAFHAVAPDQRGYARSSKPEGVEAYRVKQLVRDVLALGDHFSPGRPFALVGARLGRLGRLCHGDRRAGAHRQAGGDQRRAPRALPARADRGRGAAPGQRLHALPARSAGRGAALGQRLREAARHADRLRAAALADAGEARRLPRGLVAAGRADRHAQLVPRVAAAGAAAGRGGRPGQGA